MAIAKEIQYATTDELYLDPLNPRLGRSNTNPKLSQERILDLMQDWTLDELAVSFLESGFWPQEALIVVEEMLYGKVRLIVIEGNRRLAALKYLQRAAKDETVPRKWRDIVREIKPDPQLFERIPYIKVDLRKDVEAFLGFRHVTGIKEWRPAEKAEYIAKLIEEGNMSYEEVMRKIGSKAPTVRQNYISYRLLLQMEQQENISLENVEEKFSVLYLSLRTAGVQRYLHIDIRADPEHARHPVPEDKLKQLTNFALWLFGDKKRPPLFTDSRLVDDFGTVLESPKAVEYLERTENPNFEYAFRTAGADEEEIVRLVASASDNVELALTRAHLHTKSEKMQREVARFGADALQLLSLFPDIRNSLLKDGK
ncbi:MAG: hypothetical protein IPO81_29670 [Kouleothrix sp.]|nr:hypothetical protein [Kouleothrix sp.]